jgi:hypothetical protein
MGDPCNGKSAVTNPPDDRPEFPPRAQTLTARTLTLKGPQRVDSAGLNISFPNGRSRRIAALPVGSGEGPLTEARAGAHSGDGNYLYVVCDLWRPRGD